ncbi:MAG: glycosyltransferase family 2 protein [Candidatus Thiodiazotropha sp.]|jgi:glycosyltransferase involved in cell wall biosynthesis
MKVSIIIPTYNYAQFIKESIDSVLLQTYRDFELLIIDDGSTDDTEEIVTEIRDSRLKYIKIPNGGVSVARNKGLELAQGEYIAFLDADDKWHPEKLELQVRIFNEYPEIGLVFTDFLRFDESEVYKNSLFSYVPELDTICKDPVLDGRGYVITSDTFNALATTKMFATWTQTCLIRSNKIGSIRFPIGVRLSEDFNFMLRIYEQVIAAYISEPLVLVRRHGNNSYSLAEQMLEPELITLYDVLGKLKEPKHKIALKTKIAHAWTSIAYHHYWHGSVMYATYAYIRALLLPSRRLNSFLHIISAPMQPIIRKIRPKE